MASKVEATLEQAYDNILKNIRIAVDEGRGPFAGLLKANWFPVLNRIDRLIASVELLARVIEPLTRAIGPLLSKEVLASLHMDDHARKCSTRRSPQHACDCGLLERNALIAELLRDAVS